MIEIIGQIFGFLAMILTFISFQTKTHKNLLLIQSASVVSVIISYSLLGQYTGAITNCICLLRNIVFYINTKRNISSKITTVFMAVLIGLSGAISWQGLKSLLVIVPLIINTIYISFDNNQRLRKSILFTSTSVLIYNILGSVYGAALSELIAITSSVIGIVRYKKISD